MKISRREFLKSLFLLGSGIFLPGKRLRFRLHSTSLIRPPGSLVEEDFTNKCIRCGECLKVCSAQCLKPVPLREGIFSWATPRITPREAGCIRCLSCSQICPSGAIQKVNIEEVKMGTAKIQRERCLVWKENKECLICREYCPVGAISPDSRDRPVVNPEICVGCGLCEENCPVLEEEAAITVSTQGEKRYYLQENRLTLTQHSRNQK